MGWSINLMDTAAILAKAARRRDLAIQEARRQYEKIAHLLASPEGQTLLELSGANNDDVTTTTTLPGQWPGLRNAIRLSAATQPDQITINTVKKFIGTHYPAEASRLNNASISLQLRRMESKTEELRIVRPGTAGRQTVFKAVALRSVPDEYNEHPKSGETSQAASP